MSYAKPHDKDLGRLLREATAQGWTVTGGGHKHYRALSPDHSRTVVISASSSRRGDLNVWRAKLALR